MRGVTRSEASGVRHLEIRHVGAQGRIKIEASLLGEHGRQGGGEGFGDRANLEERIPVNIQRRAKIGDAHAAGMDLAVRQDAERHARHVKVLARRFHLLQQIVPPGIVHHVIVLQAFTVKGWNHRMNVISAIEG